MHIVDGYLSDAIQHGSENHDLRPGGEISLIVIHCISLPRGQFGNDFVRALFCSDLDCDCHPDFDDLRGLRVSSHLLIRRDGLLEQFVSFRDRAWHAGDSSFEGRVACNDYSVGIELEGTDTDEFTEAQYVALLEVCQLLIAEFGIDAVVGHQDIAPGRKTDPGCGFHWQRLRTSFGHRVKIGGQNRTSIAPGA